VSFRPKTLYIIFPTFRGEEENVLEHELAVFLSFFVQKFLQNQRMPWLTI
jgi:hypothetical protein